MTMSTSTPRRSSSGSTAAQLPTSPTDTASPAAFARRHRSTASSSESASSSRYRVCHPPPQPPLRDVHDQAHPAVERHRQRLRATHAAAPAGDGQRAAQRSRRTACPRRPRTSRRCPAGSPGCRCRSTTRRSSARTSSARAAPAGGTPARSPSRRRGSSWRSAPAAPTRASAAPRPGRPDWTSSVSSPSSVVSVRTSASNDGPVPRRPPRPAVDDEVVRAARRRPGPGCSGASAAAPRSATSGRSAWCRGAARAARHRSCQVAGSAGRRR